MNGRVFSVAEGIEKIKSVLDIDDPEEFKNAMPWGDFDPQSGNDALMAQGRAIPPFHGRCRCVVVATDAETAPAVQPQAGNTGKINLGNSLEGYTDSQKQEIVKLLDNAPQEIQNAFAKHASQFKEVDSYVDPSIGKAYFSPSDGRVHMNRQDVAAGDAWNAQYQTHFHEYGHNLDYLAGNGRFVSSSWTNTAGETLEDIIEKDWERSLRRFYTSDPGNGYKQSLETQLGKGGMGGEAYLRAVLSTWRAVNGLSRNDSAYLGLRNELDALNGSKKSFRKYWEKHFDTFRDMAYDNFINKKDVVDQFIVNITTSLSKRERCDISDMFELHTIKISNCARPFGFGHGSQYWSKGDLAREAFAEMTAASITSPESLAQIQKYLPNAYAAYLEIIRRIN